MDGTVGLPAQARRAAGATWTRERIALLKRRWSRGVSARRIAQALGGGISREAVLGKIHRLGLAGPAPGRKPAAAEGERRARARAARSRPTARPEATLPPRAWRLPPGPAARAGGYVDDPRVDADIPLPQRRSLLELDRHACRWPIGDPRSPDFLFCGAKPRRGKPYCAAHCARAHISEEER
jgi:GcrA cell cycle regulator